MFFLSTTIELYRKQHSNIIMLSAMFVRNITNEVFNMYKTQNYFILSQSQTGDKSLRTEKRDHKNNVFQMILKQKFSVPLNKKHTFNKSTEWKLTFVSEK